MGPTTMINHAREAAPVVLSINTLDPSGITGLHADIETCASSGSHCLAVASAICARDSRDIKEVQPLEAGLVIAQTRALLEDMPVSAIKTGTLASVEIIEVVHSIINDYPHLPVVLQNQLTHPAALQDPDQIQLADATCTLLLPKAFLATVDAAQAFKFAPAADTLDACAAEILERGCHHLLITGINRDTPSCSSKLYGSRGLIRSYDNGGQAPLNSPAAESIMSASILAYLAHGLELQECIPVAQKYTWASLAQGRHFGMGEPVPNRLHWATQALS